MALEAWVLNIPQARDLRVGQKWASFLSFFFFFFSFFIGFLMQVPNQMQTNMPRDTITVLPSNSQKTPGHNKPKQNPYHPPLPTILVGIAPLCSKRKPPALPSGPRSTSGGDPSDVGKLVSLLQQPEPQRLSLPPPLEAQLGVWSL